MLVRHQRLREDGHCIEHIAGAACEIEPALLAGSIEGFIGFARVPLGVAGPVRIEGAAARGDFFVPLATSEGTLVASFQHAFNAINRCGGARAACTQQHVGRAPCFEFANLDEACRFAQWIPTRLDALREAVAGTSRFCRLLEARVAIVGNTVYTLFDFTTGDAAGQNMVTIATEALCRHACAAAPVKPGYWFVEANFSGDKKASALAFVGRRGRAASATVELDRDLVAASLHTTPERMHDYWRMSALGGVMSGTIGVQGHYANGLAALYLATGQDVACVAESAVGVTRMELRGERLFVSVTLPSLVLGTVGGGTGLPSQAAGLRLMGLEGDGKAAALAEVAAALCLAGEISIIGALAAGDFARAHEKLARHGS